MQNCELNLRIVVGETWLYHWFTYPYLAVIIEEDLKPVLYMYSRLKLIETPNMCIIRLFRIPQISTSRSP